MRPNSIILFERLYLGAIAIGFLNVFVSWNKSMALMTGDPGAAALGNPAIFLIVSYVVGFVISLTLWYFAARRRSNVAKWVLIVLFAIGLLGVPNAIAQGIFTGIGGLLALASWIMQAAAIFMLFRRDAVAWFKGPTQDEVVERFE